MQEVRLPAYGGDAAEKGVSVRLSTRTDLRRAHTVPEAQVLAHSPCATEMQGEQAFVPPVSRP